MEGESDVIEEDDEHNNSFDHMRRSRPKRNKSAMEFDETDGVNAQDFLQELMADRNLMGEAHLNERKKSIGN